MEKAIPEELDFLEKLNTDEPIDRQDCLKEFSGVGMPGQRVLCYRM